VTLQVEQRGGYPEWLSNAAIVMGPAVIGAFYIIKFPRLLFLGDGWIFLQYARNLALGNGWSLNSGEVSFGATSPAWVVLLAGVYRISPGHFETLSGLLGLVFFSLAILLMFRALRFAMVDTFSPWAAVSVTAVALVPFSGLFYAISAMETGLYLALFTAAVCMIQRRASGFVPDLLFGTLSGLLFLTRPEGIVCAALYLAVDWPRPQRFLRTLAVAGGLLIVIAPWELFMFLNSGHFLPTSGNGRLYGYINIVYPTLTLNEYLDLSFVGRLWLIPTVIRTQFFQHPVMLVFCLLPFLLVCGVFGAEMTARRPQRLSLFLMGYCGLTLAAYIMFQPLLFQRYFVTFLPSAVITLAPFLSAPRRRVGIVPAAAVGLCIAALNVGAFRYYRDHAELDAETIRLVRAVRSEGAPCRLAAEPLGYAAYFTSCYVIDLGGLINPDIWEYWKQGKDSLQYALDQRANFVLADAGLAARRFVPLHRERDRVLYGVGNAIVSAQSVPR
jgi:hypothetical protein